MSIVSIDQIRAAATRLKGVSSRTPLESSRALSELAGGVVHLKCENLQRTGAFKIRGAYNRLSTLTPDEAKKGVVAASAGNHAQGVALAARILGIKATVFMPVGAALPKFEATTSYGATVRLEGSVYDEAFAAAERFASETGAIIVHPFDHEDVIAGQGTVGLEILEQSPEAKVVVVPVGGGGLIAGIAAAVKGMNPQVRIIGVEPEGAANMSAAIAAGKLVKIDQLTTVADGLAAKTAGVLPFEHVKSLVDDIVTVTDDEIAEALLLMTERAKLVVEPAGAAGVAAVMKGKVKIQDPSVVVLSGGNIDPLLLLRVIRFGLGSAGRYLSFTTKLSDRPGELHRLLGVIADGGGNVVGVEHHREGMLVRHLGEVEIAVQVETRGQEHVEELMRAVTAAGYRLEWL